MGFESPQDRSQDSFGSGAAPKSRSPHTSFSGSDGPRLSQQKSFEGEGPDSPHSQKKAPTHYSVGRRKRVMPLGAARRFVMEPHGYYDMCAEVLETGGATPTAKFMRSKIRCSSFAEWMEITNPETGKPIWRMEARFSDRSFYAPDMMEHKGKKERTQNFVTVVRLYRGYEKNPTLMLVHRDKAPCGIGEPQSNKTVEVYMCMPLGDRAAADLDPDAELDNFLGVSTAPPTTSLPHELLLRPPCVLKGVCARSVLC